MKNKYTDSEILEILTRVPDQEDQVIRFLYKECSATIKGYIRKNGGSDDDANDVIQDAIIIFYERVKNNRFSLDSTIAAFIFSVGKYIWFNKKRRQHKNVSFEKDTILGMIDDQSKIDIEMFGISKSALVNEILENIGPDCKKILVDSVYRKIPMKEIARINGYKNEQVARNKKFKCLKLLREIVSKSPRLQLLFKEISE